MGLEDMAMFRALPTATIFYPSDGVSTEKAVELAATTKVCKNRSAALWLPYSICGTCIYYKKQPICCLLIVMFPYTKGVCYIRTSRQDSAIIYNSNEDFHVGQAKVRRCFYLHSCKDRE